MKLWLDIIVCVMDKLADFLKYSNLFFYYKNLFIRVAADHWLPLNNLEPEAWPRFEVTLSSNIVVFNILPCFD